MENTNSSPQLLAFVRNQLAQSEAFLETLTRDNQSNVLPHRDLYNTAITYLNSFLKERSEPRWLAIAGLRGVGKTTLLAKNYWVLVLSAWIHP